MVNKKETDESITNNFESDEGENNVEEAEYSPKSEFSKPEVVKQRVNNCGESRSKGMNPGYYNTKLTKDGNAIRTWVEDERKVYIGSVNALKLVLTPEIDEDHELDDLDEELSRQEKIIFDKYVYTPIMKKRVDGKHVWVKTGESPYIPNADQPLPVNDSKHPHSLAIDYLPGFWNSKVNSYWDEMVEVYDELFAELNRLIHKKNYFKQTVSY